MVSGRNASERLAEHLLNALDDYVEKL